MITIQIIDSTIPASKKGIGRISGPTPRRRFTEVNNAAYFDDISMIIV